MENAIEKHALDTIIDETVQWACIPNNDFASICTTVYSLISPTTLFYIGISWFGIKQRWALHQARFGGLRGGVMHVVGCRVGAAGPQLEFKLIQKFATEYGMVSDGGQCENQKEGKGGVSVQKTYVYFVYIIIC